MFFASILIKIYYTNIILLKSIFIALCLKKFLTFQRKISFFPDWWYNGRGLSTKHRWYSENTNHHKRHFGNQFQNQGDLHSEYTHCLKIQKIFNWKIDSIFFFPPIIIIGHGYKYDWCGWATLRTKEMAKMFWFSSSSDLCSFLSRIWSGILILYYHACRQLFWIPEKVQFEEVAHLFEKNQIKCPCIPMGKNVMVFWLLKWYSILIYFLTHNSGSGWRWFDQSHDGID